MKPTRPWLALLVLPCLATAAGTALAGAAAPKAHHALPYAQCIQLDHINEWHVLDQRTALVRTGPDRYLVSLQADCPRLGIGVPGLLFHTSASDQAVGGGRICGDLGETVGARTQPPCAIESVSRIDKAQFDRLEKQAKRHGSGAEPMGNGKP